MLAWLDTPGLHYPLGGHKGVLYALGLSVRSPCGAVIGQRWSVLGHVLPLGDPQPVQSHLQTNGQKDRFQGPILAGFRSFVAELSWYWHEYVDVPD